MSGITTGLLIFGLIFLVGGGVAIAGLLYTIFARSEVEERLGAYAVAAESAPTRMEIRRKIPITRVRSRLNTVLAVFISPELNLQLLSANWPITEVEYVLIRLWGTFAGFFLGWLLLSSPISGIGLGLLAYIVPALHLRRAIYQRRLKFERQLVDVLVLMAGAVKAGYSLPQSLEFIINEMGAPASEEFRRVLYEVNLGLPLTEALQNLVTRMQNDDLYLLVTAININSQVGGNLVTMLQSVTATIRDRIRLFGEIRALTAQQRYNSYILTLLPFAFAGLMFLMNPNYIKKLFEPGIALCFPIGALISIFFGNIVIRKVSRIQV